MSNIEALIKENAKSTDRELEKYFSQKDGDFKVLFDAMEYSLTAKGKRIRPFLVMQFCKMLGGRDEEAKIYAASLEMVHTYSLIHDDLPCMDDDDLRRGIPTCHKKFGEATALLAGDALLTYAFEIISGADNISDKNKVKAINIISKAAGRDGMIGGQQLDLLGEKNGVDYEKMTRMHSLKTGMLIKAACLLGCLSADVYSGEIIEKAEIYAEGIGRVFQLVDDILDVTSSTEKLGKTAHSDEKKGKTTYLSFMSVDMARQVACLITEKACESIKELDKDKTLCELAIYLRDRAK